MSIRFKTPAKRLAWAAAACVALHAVPAAAQLASAGAAAPMPVAATDRLIIKYRSAADLDAPSLSTQATAAATASSRGRKLQHVRRLGNGAHLFKLDRALPMAEAQQLINDVSNGNADIEYAEPDVLLQPLFTPNDALYWAQWNLYNTVVGINATTAWDKSIGAGVVVAVVDSGVRPHVDLKANLLPGYDFITDLGIANDGTARDSDPYDPGDWTPAGACGVDEEGKPIPPVDRPSSWHGTHVAGIVAALTNNATGVAGVAYGARVLPVRALGRCNGRLSDAADAVMWASGSKVGQLAAPRTPAQVINLSLGGKGSCSQTIQNAINTARANGAVVVVAAGNEAQNAVNVQPANCVGVVTVAASNHTGGRASYSNYGSPVDLAAPGGEAGRLGIASTANAGAKEPAADNYIYLMGTSMAAPHVAGVAALMLSRNPSLTPDEVEERLKESTRPFPATCDQCGTGLLDATRAVEAADLPATINVTERGDNDSYKTAQRVPALPALVSGTLAATDDKDFYRVQIPVGARLQAKLTTSAKSDYSLALFTRNGTLLTNSKQVGLGVEEELTYTNNSKTGKVLVLQVRRASGKYGPQAPYSLSVGMY